MEVADRCTVLRKGKHVGTVNVRETTKEELSRMMVGREVSFTVEKGRFRPGGVELEVRILRCLQSCIKTTP
jgi:simple sugar transport system ATP-binding protein